MRLRTSPSRWGPTSPFRGRRVGRTPARAVGGEAAAEAAVVEEAAAVEGVAAAVAVAADTAGELMFQRLENITVYRFYVENVYAEARYAVTGMSGSLAHHIGPVCTELWMFAPFTNLLM